MPNAATLAAFKIKIDAVNDASDTLLKISREMKSIGKIGAQDAKQGLFDRLGLTGKNMRALGAGFSAIKSGAMSAIGTVGLFIPAIGAVAVAAAGIGIVAGIGKMVTGFSSLAATTGRTAAMLGIPVQQFYNLQKSGELAGLSTDQVTTAISGLQDGLNDAAFGRNNALAQMFTAFHIGFGDVAHGAANVLVALPQMAEEVKYLADTGQNHAALHLLDASGMGRDSFTFLRFGTEGLAAWNAEAAKSPPLTLDMVKKAYDLQQSQTALTQQFRGMGFELMQALAPSLISVTQGLDVFLQNHPEQIKASFDSVGRGLKLVIDGLRGLAKVADAVSKVVKTDYAMGYATGRFAGDVNHWVLDKLGIRNNDKPPPDDENTPGYVAPEARAPDGGGGGPAAGPGGQTQTGQESDIYARAYAHKDQGAIAAGMNNSVEAWCAKFVNQQLKEVGIQGTGSAVATSFLKWGETVADKTAVKTGDVLVQAHGAAAGETGGHVLIASGKTRAGTHGQEQIEAVSGNYGDKVGHSWEDASSIDIRRAAIAAKAAGPAGPDAPAPAPSDSGGGMDNLMARLRIDVDHGTVPTAGYNDPAAPPPPTVPVAPVRTRVSMPEAV